MLAMLNNNHGQKAAHAKRNHKMQLAVGCQTTRYGKELPPAFYSPLVSASAYRLYPKSRLMKWYLPSWCLSWNYWPFNMHTYTRLTSPSLRWLKFVNQFLKIMQSVNTIRTSFSIQITFWTKHFMEEQWNKNQSDWYSCSQSFKKHLRI